MKICAISDLHGFLIDYIEPCELVLICGDIVPLYMQRNKPQCEKWLKTVFADWIKSLPCKKVVFTAGNHDFVFENRDFLMSKKTRVAFQNWLISKGRNIGAAGADGIIGKETKQAVYNMFFELKAKAITNDELI